MTDQPQKTTPKWYAMLHARCPRCRRGKMFSGGLYDFGNNKIYKNCPHCNMQFEIEPGYFYAAMYVSYALNVAEAVNIAILTYLISGNTESPWLYTTTILLGCLILAPFNFRYSRVILLFWLSPKVHYQPYLDDNDSTPYLWFFKRTGR